MSQARLRRLDALFAEKVLGLRGDFFYELGPNKNVDLIKPEITQDLVAIHHYTRSLDAAWEGVGDIYAVKFFYAGIPSPYWTAQIDRHDETSFDSGCHMPTTPAEALVLACLRAVGCGEEELE